MISSFRHVGISLEMLLKLVKIFGPVIHSTLSAGPMVGVDIQAEQRCVWFSLHLHNHYYYWQTVINPCNSSRVSRLEKCNLCFIELEKVKRRLPSLTRYMLHGSSNKKVLRVTLPNIDYCLYYRRGGSISKSAQELNLTLQEVIWNVKHKHYVDLYN